MKQMSKFLLLLSITLLMAGCKLAVIVVEGGEVQSTGSGTCAEGTICIVDVTDTNFRETFTAVPGSGWYFQKWNSGDNFFFGGSILPTCSLSFGGHEESKAVADMVASSELFYLMPVFKPYQDIITVNGNEWLQPALFTNLSWDEIKAVCPAGHCADHGVLNGYDMTGWTWASVDDLNALFNYYLGSDEMGPGPTSVTLLPDVPDDVLGMPPEPTDPPWATEFFNDGWRATGGSSARRNGDLYGGVDFPSRYCDGHLRGELGGGSDYTGSASIHDNEFMEFAFVDVMSTHFGYHTLGDAQRNVHWGAWFYRTR